MQDKKLSGGVDIANLTIEEIMMFGAKKGGQALAARRITIPTSEEQSDILLRLYDTYIYYSIQIRIY